MKYGGSESREVGLHRGRNRDRETRHGQGSESQRNR